MAWAVSLVSTYAGLVIPSDGSDGALVITNNAVIDLSQAVTGRWDSNNQANAGQGIYDPNKWAVVFKYSQITIEEGATVTFKNHSSRAPVVWLVQGDVTINGVVKLDGEDGQAPPGIANAGPGGFRGGSGFYAFGAGASAGFGPGGGGGFGGTAFAGAANGAGASYASIGGTPGGVNTAGVYGNPSLLPLIGGSGGCGNNSSVGGPRGGGGGGGAILIAGGNLVTINGTLQANGGKGFQTGNDSAGYFGYSGGGSGGGIRLLADTLAGAGRLVAIGGQSGNPGGLGRVSIQRVTAGVNLQMTPEPHVVALTDGSAPLIWLPTNGPSIRVVSIQDIPASADPRAEIGALGADTVLPQITSATVVVETTNVEKASTVKVRATPRSNGTFSETEAAMTTVVSEDPLVLRWTANVPVMDGYSAIQAKVVRP